MTNPASLSVRLFLMVALTLLVGLAFASPRTTSAGTPLIHVTKTADTADGTCDSDCSLREAIIASNATPTDILLAAGTYTLTIPGTGEDASATGDLDINSATNILGAGADTTIIDGGGLDRVFHFRFPAVSEIAGVTIRNGGSNFGSGIYIAGGSLDLENSTVSGNTASGNGGGIYNQATLTINDSTISGNTAPGGSGGGIYNFSIGAETLVNSTVSGNSANFSGGGIYNVGPATTILSSVTISDNSATGSATGGGGIKKDGSGGSVSLKNTIVANSSSGGNCSGAITSNGHNLDSGTTCALTGSGDLSGTDPLLVPLALNSPGPTKTHALPPNSPAVDAGSSDCPPPANDQRGVSRPLGAACDIGAYEVDPRGDTDCNGKVEGLDLLDVLRDVSDVGTPAVCHQNGDVDGDGHITTTDALLIAQYWAGTIPTFPEAAN